MVIYKITNTINGKSYIGQTIQNVQKRWRRHCAPSSIKSAIGFAIQKYGKINFIFEVIDTASSIKELNEKEIYCIKNLETISPKGYNLTRGGLNYKITVELSKKLSDNWHVEGRKDVVSNLRLSNIGRKATEEAKKNMSEAQKGRKHSEETKTKISLKNKGKEIPYISIVKSMISKVNSSKNKGVRYKEKTEQYEAYICIEGKNYSKCFSAKKLGHDQAEYLARCVRLEFEKKYLEYYNNKLNTLIHE